MSQVEVCPCCPNHCPKEQLRCPRGRNYFEGGADAAQSPHHHQGIQQNPNLSTEELVIGLLRKCGHMLHHGAAQGTDLLSNLSDAEKEQLKALLEKCVSAMQ
jgi:hypothetical protein